MKNLKALILAGGFGTRLRESIKDIPKPMASIAGKPFLEHQIRNLKKTGIENIILGVHYKSEFIKSHFGNGAAKGVKIIYSEEDVPLGTGGAIKLAQKHIEDKFLVLNGDSHSDVEIEEFIQFHESKKLVGSMVVNEMERTEDYGRVELRDDLVVKMQEKTSSKKGLINSGIYLFEPEIFNYIPEFQKVSLEEEILPNLIKENKISGFVHKGYFMDIGKPETYIQFKRDFLDKLKSSTNITLREAIKKMYDNDYEILFMVDSNQKFLGLLTDNVVKRYLINSGKLEDKVSEVMITNPERLATIEDSEEKIKSYLEDGVKQLPVLDEERKIHDVIFRKEETKIEEYPIVRGKTPLRISFAGGGTDIPTFFEEHGGAVISTTIDKFCRITAKKRGDSLMVIDSDMCKSETIFNIKNLNYDGGTFDLVKAVYNLTNSSFGVDLFLNNDIPPGRGLGSSASFAVLLTKILGKLKGRDYRDEELAEIAYNAETLELKIRGGKQDQYAALFGGVNWIEFGNGDKKIMHPLRIKDNVLNELQEHLTLCYTGQEHESNKQQEALVKNYQENSSEVTERLKKIKEGANKTKEYLLSTNPNFPGIGEILHQSWIAKKNVSPNMTNKGIDELYETGRIGGAYGGKLLGSGGGGYILFFHPPKERNRLERALKEKGGELLDFNFTDFCATIWSGDKY